MKKFIPYIFITAFIGAFLMISFSPSFSGTFSEPKKAYAEAKKIVETRGAETLSEANKDVGKAGSNSMLWGATKAVADLTFGNVLAWISEITMIFSRLLFNASAYLMDKAIDFSIRDFKANIEGIGIMTQGYKIILNVANMIFIFLLLYIAIKTILGDGGDIKKLLAKIIVVGLMINFSLFMTKVVIDATNIIAMGFYNGIHTTIETKTKTIKSVGSVSTTMMEGLRFSSILPSKNSEFIKRDAGKGYGNFTMSIVNFGGSAFLVIAAFVFFSVAILFLLRFVTLLFYMMTSPVAFLGYISPQLSDYSKKWWTGLLSQAQFAPIFMLTMYLISAMINSGALTTLTKAGDGTFYDDLASGFTLGFSSILNFVILIALMLGALITAKAGAKTGSDVGFEYAQKFQGWAQGMMGRNVVGRAAYLAGNNRYMGKIMKKMPTLGTFAKTQFDRVADVKFGKDNKIGYTGALKKSIDKKKKMAEFVAKSDLKETSESLRKEERRLDEKNEFRIEQMKKTNEARKEIERLKHINADMKAFGSWTKADTKADIDASKILAREESLLENAERDMTKINTNIDILKKFTQKNISNIANREYAKNIEFGSSILNKLFPSGADAAAEIRKGKKPVMEVVRELMEEAGDIPKKEGGGGGATGGAGGTTGGGTGTTPP